MDEKIGGENAVLHPTEESQGKWQLNQGGEADQIKDLLEECVRVPRCARA
jgi:hypothetical protein